MIQARRGRGHHGASRPAPTPSWYSRGQALIEFTLFFSFMMLMLAGVTDVAFLLDAHVNVVYAARQGARVGALMGNSPIADCAILGTIEATLQGASDVTVTQITIYRATSTGQPDPSNQEIYPGGDSCPSGTAVPNPPVLVVPSTPPALNNYPSFPACSTPAPPPPPNCRNTTPLYEDSLGVQINYTYQFRFNLWQGGTLNLSDYATYPIVVQV